MNADDESDIDSLKQKILFEKIHEEYELHYYDKYSMKYREQFIYKKLFHCIDLNDCEVAELASGSGHNSRALISKFPKIRIVGYDISEKACTDYHSNTNCESFQIDLTKKFESKTKYDVIIIIGGLHHCIADLPTTFHNIANMLKPKGLLLMVEPNKNFILQYLRDLWYKTDKKYFDYKTESALDHDQLMSIANKWFALDDIWYMGGPAHLLILNSLIFRMPLKLKCILAQPLFFIEQLYNHLPGKRWFSLFGAIWHLKEAS